MILLTEFVILLVITYAGLLVWSDYMKNRKP